MIIIVPIGLIVRLITACIRSCEEQRVQSRARSQARERQRYQRMASDVKIEEPHIEISMPHPVSRQQVVYPQSPGYTVIAQQPPVLAN